VTCPNCGASVDAAVARCPHCQAMLAFTVPASAQPSPAGLHPNHPVRSVRGVGIAAVVLAVLATLASLAYNALINFSSVTDSRFLRSSLVQVLALISSASVIVMIVWLWRARKNVDAMVGTAPRWTAGWTIGAWFIPVANLVLIPLVIVDVARNSLDEARGRRATAVVWAWAAVQLVGGLVAGGLAALIPFATAARTEPRTAGIMFAAVAGVGLVNAALRIAFINMITTGQHERIAPALGEPRRTKTLPPGPLAPVTGEHRPPSYG
jgi:protein-S-isoprenylcysteine O-methyltransferase Ste14